MSVRNTILTTMLLTAGGSATAADHTPPPAVAAGTVVGLNADAAGCVTCTEAQGGGGDKKGGHGLAGRLRRPPIAITLAPGACFGYFPTQWRKWDEVCPYPYSPPGPGDGARPPVPYPGYSDPKTPNGELPTPRPVDPKSDAPVKPAPGGARALPPFPPGPKTSAPVPVSTRPLPATPAPGKR